MVGWRIQDVLEKKQNSHKTKDTVESVHEIMSDIELYTENNRRF